MNKKGISELYMIIAQVIAVGLIFALLTFKAQDVDIDGIHRNMVSKDIGLTLNTISFLPDNIKYTYLTKDDNNWVDWKTFYIELGKNSLAYYEDPPSIAESLIQPGKFTFLSNKKQTYGGKIDKDNLAVYEDSFIIDKSDEISLVNEEPNLEKLKCKPSKLKYEFKPLHLCDKIDVDGDPVYCDKDGVYLEIHESDFEIIYNGFEKRYFVGKNEYFKGKGLVSKPNFETEIISNILENMNQESSENKVYLTLNEDEKNNIIIKIPYDDFEKDYNLGCNLINKILDSKLEIDGATIMPSRDNKIIIELGNIKSEKEGFSEILEAFN